MRRLDPARLKSWLTDGGEIALLDLRQPEAFQSGHLLLAANVPLPVCAEIVSRLVPRLSTRVVLVDEDDGTAEAAGERLHELGYSNLTALAGGVETWADSGFELFSGTYTVNNVFALCVERQRATPRITAEELESSRAAGEKVVVLDSRPLEEFQAGSIPGAINVPLAELIERVPDLAPDPKSHVVINCGGRARAVLGCQSLIDARAKCRVSALYYGTMGWDLAGLTLSRGETRQANPPTSTAKTWAKAQARHLATRFAVNTIDLGTLDLWRAEVAERTLYLIDVRGRREYDAGHVPESRWVPGGELVGLTEDHMATRNARVCLIDDTGARATLTAGWLRQMGWADAAVLAGGIKGWTEAGRRLSTSPSVAVDDPKGSVPAADRDQPARHAAYRRLMAARESLPDQLARDGTLQFWLPPDL